MPKHRVYRHDIVQPLSEAYRLIPLTQGQNAIVDIDNFAFLSQWNWHAIADPSIKNSYAARVETVGRCSHCGSGIQRTLQMHRVILNCPEGKLVDHVNGNSLDNRKENLRIATEAQNARNHKAWTRNPSGFKGVHRNRGMKPWRARIVVNGKNIAIGFFESPEEAAKAYDKEAKKHHGQFARLNFPE